MYLMELQNAGLSMNEAKVYLALLDLGSATPTEIAKTAGIHRPNTYESIQSLIKKGAVMHIEKNNKKYYEAQDPEALLGLLNNQVQRFREILPKLKVKKEFANRKKSKAQIFEGLKAIQMTIYKFLEFKKPIFVYGVPKDAAERMKYFIGQFHRERIAKKIPMHHIYNDDAPKRMLQLMNLPYTKVKVLPKRFNSDVSTLICAHQLVLVHWQETPTITVINNAALAESYVQYFKILWDSAITPNLN